MIRKPSGFPHFPQGSTGHPRLVLNGCWSTTHGVCAPCPSFSHAWGLYALPPRTRPSSRLFLLPTLLGGVLRHTSAHTLGSSQTLVLVLSYLNWGPQSIPPFPLTTWWKRNPHTVRYLPVSSSPYGFHLGTWHRCRLCHMLAETAAKLIHSELQPLSTKLQQLYLC